MKMSIPSLFLCMLVAGGIAVADGETSDLLDVALADTMSLCVDEECSMIWLSGDEVEELVWPNSGYTTSTDVAEEVPISSVFEDNITSKTKTEGGEILLVPSGGDCEYIVSPDGDVIHCKHAKGESPYVVVGKYVNYDMIVMCYYNENDAVWEVGGFSFFGTSFQLSIDGNSGGEYFWIQRYADELAGGECKFDDFTDRFDPQYGSGHVLTVDAEGNDRLAGVFGSDVVVGGDGRDELWGGEGDDDLHPDQIDFNTGYIDTCYGGTPDPPDLETDMCVGCEIPDSCKETN